MKGKHNKINYLYNNPNLYEALASALSHSFVNLSVREPQLIANLVYYIPKEVNQLNLPISTLGVFVHQKPYIRYNGMAKNARIEIGDLLLIRTLKHTDKTISRSALLIQAKKIFPNDDISYISKTNQNQHNLYALWPKFEFISNPLAGITRFVTGPNLHNGSKYLLIPNSPCLQKACLHFCFIRHNCKLCRSSLTHPNICSLTAFALPQVLSNFQCFYLELIDFILGNAGREFIYQPANNTNWDQVITDLINITQIQIKKLNTTSSINGARQNGIMFCSKTSSLPSDDYLLTSNLPPPSNEYPNLSQDEPINDGGISIIEFFIDENEIHRKSNNTS